MSEKITPQRILLAILVGAVLIGVFYLENRSNQPPRHYTVSDVISSLLLLVLVIKTFSTEKRLKALEQQLHKQSPDAQKNDL